MPGATLDLESVMAGRIDGRTKGMPDESLTLAEVPVRGLTLSDLSLPVMTLRSSAIDHNVALMARYARDHDVELAPHGKTTMAPQLWDRQVRAGAWGLTAATVRQARVMRSVGVGRIMIANELVDPSSLRWAAEQTAEGADLWSWVDSEASVELVAQAVRKRGTDRRHRVLVELGHPRGRTGSRSIDELVAVATAAAASPHLELAGVAGYEGTVAGDRSPDSLDAVRSYLDHLCRAATRVAGEGLVDDEVEMLVSAGGSAFFDLVVDRLGRERPDRPGGVRIVTRPGCTLTHDHGFYAERSPFTGAERLEPAIELWSTVLSVPEPGQAILGFGRRDAPYDLGMPVPLVVGAPGSARSDAGGIVVERLHDQHAFCRVDGVDVRVGEIVGCGVSHPCSAFDKWRAVPVLDDDDVVTEIVATSF